MKGDRVLITLWIVPSTGKSPIFKRVKSIKGSKKEKKTINWRDHWLHKISFCY